MPSAICNKKENPRCQKVYGRGKLSWTTLYPIVIYIVDYVLCNVPELRPDPSICGPSGSGPVIILCRSGSGSGSASFD